MSKSKAPTGLSITRSDNTYTFKWKIGDKDYGDGQQLWYRINGGSWTKPAIGSSATSLSVTNTTVKTIVFQVRGNRKSYKKKVNGKTKTIKPGWSAWASKSWSVTVPGNPSLEYDNTGTNSGTFSWSFSPDKTGTAIYTRVESQTCVVRKAAEPANNNWGSTTTRSATGSVPYTEETESIAAGNIVRWFRVRTVGRAGAVDWTKAAKCCHAYGAPKAATIKSASAVSSGSTSRITAAWNGSYDRQYPIDSITLQYAIDTPTDTAMTPPASGWSDAIEVAPNGKDDKVVANVEDVISTDECMWVRVMTEHDGNAAYSSELVAQMGTLAAPDIDATPDVSTGSVSITITENTACEAACTAIFFRPEDDPSNDRIVTILPRGTTTTTITVSDIVGASTTCFGAYAFVGTYSDLVISDLKMQSAKVIDSDIASVAPENVTVAEGPLEGSVRIGWEWTWTAATKAELSWADNEYAWESTSEPKSYEVEDQFALSWVIADLDVGQRWYFRVRLIDGSGDDDVIGPWSSIVSYDLSSVPDRPVLTLSKNVINEGESVTARWAYSSADDITQGFAEICLVTFDSEGTATYGDVIAHVESGQSTEISQDWTTGTIYYLAVRTTTASGIQSSWSEAASLYVAEPVSIAITGSSIYAGDSYQISTESTTVNYVNGESSGGSSSSYITVVDISDGMTSDALDDYLAAGGKVVQSVNTTIVDETTTRVSITSEVYTFSDVPHIIAMPFSATITGAGETGTTKLSILRADDYHVTRPDEKNYDGYAGETIATYSQTGEDAITITVDDLVGSLDDGTRYLLVATVIDEYGQTASLEYPFMVDWTHKAEVPSATVVIDKYQRIAKITPIAPSNYESGDVCDIYRITADQPELIYKGAEFGTTYVDPYPAFGNFCGHRLVTRTANGDYATESGLGWYDTSESDGDLLEDKRMVIDVEGDQIELPYNIELSNAWNKDFQRTEYLGGSVQGDWNPAVTRDLNAKTVLLRGRDIDKQLAVRDLARFAGAAHIRTPDGSSVTCDIQVRENWNYNTKRLQYSLAVKAVDPEQEDGVTLTEWDAAHPVG